MPCARPPTKHGDLEFSHYADPDHNNSRMHQMARQIFADESVFHQYVDDTGDPPPYCSKCEHRDQKGDIDTRETVRRLLEDVPLYECLGKSCREALTDW